MEGDDGVHRAAQDRSTSTSGANVPDPLAEASGHLSAAMTLLHQPLLSYISERIPTAGGVRYSLVSAHRSYSLLTSRLFLVDWISVPL